MASADEILVASATEKRFDVDFNMDVSHRANIAPCCARTRRQVLEANLGVVVFAWNDVR
jgi:hypothetical protein